MLFKGKNGRNLVKSFISITLTSFRSTAEVKMAEDGTDDLLFLLEPSSGGKMKY